MYRNDLYSNTSESSRSRGGSWVYINGELYHAGVKGMKWYQHLPGTDWWKKISGEFRRGVTTYENQQRNANRATAYQTSNKSIGYTNRVQSQRYPNTIFAYGNANRDATMQRVAKPNSFGYKAKMYGTVAGQMAKRRLNKVGNNVKRVVSTARVGAKSLLKDISNRASYGASKAKKIASKYANKALSSIKTTANAYKHRVTNFLNKILGRKSTTNTLEGKPIQRSNSLVGKPMEYVPGNKPSTSYTKNLMVSKKEQPKKTVATLTSQRSPYYKG